jgi:hypothetical protein
MHEDNIVQAADSVYLVQGSNTNWAIVTGDALVTAHPTSRITGPQNSGHPLQGEAGHSASGRHGQDGGHRPCAHPASTATHQELPIHDQSTETP